MDRAALIARKHETLGKLAQARRELERLQAQVTTQGEADPDAKPSRATRRRLLQLQTTVERLMAEEYRLRLAIDRA